MRSKWKILSVDWLLIVLLSILTIGRFIIQMKIPPVTYVGGGVDEHVFVNQALNILKGEWFGEYNSITLVKNPVYSFFYVGINKLGISYPIALIGVHIFAILAVIGAIFPIVKNKFYLSFTYLFLLYSPVMLDKKFGFRLYRDALLTPLVLMVLASVIGLFLYRNRSKLSMVGWSTFGGISFFLFAYLREDSMWLKPFFYGAILLTIIGVLVLKTNWLNKLLKVGICFIPMLLIFGLTNVLAYKNEQVYGVNAINDHTQTNFSHVITDLVSIDDETNQEYIWVHEGALRSAFEVSPTLKKLEEQFDSFYIENSTLTVKVDSEEQAEIFSGKIVWLMRLAVERAGYGYKPYIIVDGEKVPGAIATDDFYKNVHQELTEAFESGELKKRTEGIAISKSAPAKSVEDIVENVVPKVLFATGQTINYSMYFINDSLSFVSGDTNRIREIEMLISTPLNYPSNVDQSQYNRPITKMIPLVNSIMSIYQYTAIAVLICAMSGFIFSLYKLMRKDFEEKYIAITLISLGLISSYFALLFGISWAYSWVSGETMNRLYFYTSGSIPILQMFYVISGIGFFEMIKQIFRKFKKV